MAGAEPSGTGAFPAPVRIGGYARLTWELFRGSFARFAVVFVGGVALVRTISFLLVVAVGQSTSGRSGDVATLATSLASGITLAAVVGSIACGLAVPSFVEHVCGRRITTSESWRRLRPRLSQVLVAGLYVSMPLVLLLFVVGPAVEVLLTVMILPALLGPPVLVQAIAWEGRDFRDGATRAKNLLAGSWGRVFSALLLITIAAAIVQIMALSAVAQLLGGGTPDTAAGYAVALVLEAATTGSVWLLACAAATVAYLDLRARAESLDREGLVAEAEAPAPAA